jgi:hypothetical protein
MTGTNSGGAGLPATLQGRMDRLADDLQVRTDDVRALPDKERVGGGDDAAVLAVVRDSSEEVLHRAPLI